MISRQDVEKEIVHPNKVFQSEDNKFIWTAIYKAIYMCMRLLLDVRTNQTKMMEKLGIKLENSKKDVPTS